MTLVEPRDPKPGTYWRLADPTNQGRLWYQGRCPVCERIIDASRTKGRPGREIRLRRHKREVWSGQAGTPSRKVELTWCPGRERVLMPTGDG